MGSRRAVAPCPTPCHAASARRIARGSRVSLLRGLIVLLLLLLGLGLGLGRLGERTPPCPLLWCKSHIDQSVGEALGGESLGCGQGIVA